MCQRESVMLGDIPSRGLPYMLATWETVLLSNGARIETFSLLTKPHPVTACGTKIAAPSSAIFEVIRPIYLRTVTGVAPRLATIK